MAFNQLNIIEPIVKALQSKGYTQPTPIQSQAIPVVLDGKDLLGSAQTGTGKTAAFAIPVLQLLHSNRVSHPKPRPIRALVLTPTRELAIQVEESFKAYGKHTGLYHTVVFGGVPQRKQTDALKRGVDILVATPGRLLDLMNQRYIHLDKVELFVLDEADRMLDMGFMKDLDKIIPKLPANRQTLFFSATMPPQIQSLANSILKDPVRISVVPVSTAAETVKQSVYFVNKENKKSLLIHLMQEQAMDRVLIFTRTKRGAERLVNDLLKADIQADAIHGDKSQGARQRALSKFKAGKIQVLVATDIAARGIDVEYMPYVINYDVPNEAETYIHRIGRTGRAGADGVAISFCDREEWAFWKDIAKLLKKEVEVVEEHPYPGPIPKASPKHEERSESRNNNNHNRSKRNSGGQNGGNRFNRNRNNSKKSFGGERKSGDKVNGSAPKTNGAVPKANHSAPKEKERGEKRATVAVADKTEKKRKNNTSSFKSTLDSKKKGWLDLGLGDLSY